MVMINDQQGFKNIAELMTNPQCPACGEKLDFKQEDAATGQLLPTFKAQHHDKDFVVDLNAMPVIVSVSPTPQPKAVPTPRVGAQTPAGHRYIDENPRYFRQFDKRLGLIRP